MLDVAAIRRLGINYYILPSLVNQTCDRMKHTHATITGTILSLVFVVVGFAAILAAILAVPFATISYTISLIIFLIVLWVLMLYVMHAREPVPSEGRARRRAK